MTYKNIVFDIGRVLIDYDWMTMLKDHGLSEQEALDFAMCIFPDPLWKELDIGILSNDEIVRRYGEKFSQYRELSRWFIDNAHLMPVPRPRVWEKVRELRKAGYKIYLLSNYNEWLFETHLADTPVRELADGAVISYEIHKIKPEPEIYQALFERYGLDPADCIFFDDREENVEGAKAVGMDAVQIFSEEQVLQEIKKLLQ